MKPLVGYFQQYYQISQNIRGRLQGQFKINFCYEIWYTSTMNELVTWLEETLTEISGSSVMATWSKKYVR